jgi:hypothetical protein
MSLPFPYLKIVNMIKQEQPMDSLTPYQKFVTQDLFNTAHTSLTTKAAWNAALDSARREILQTKVGRLTTAQRKVILDLIADQKEK